MTLRTATLLAVLAALVPASRGDIPAAFAYNDDLVMPGFRMGPVYAGCTREELGTVFGDRKLLDTTIDVGEGTFLPGTIIRKGSSTEIQVVWMDGGMDMPAEVWAVGRDLHTERGIRIGTTLRELAELMGPFELAGFAWDCEGTVFLEGTYLENYSGGLIIRLSPTPEAIEAHPGAYDRTMGDTVFSSTDPDMQALNPSVYSLGLLFY
jgi:hypothetical protein